MPSCPPTRLLALALAGLLLTPVGLLAQDESTPPPRASDTAPSLQPLARLLVEAESAGGDVDRRLAKQGLTLLHTLATNRPAAVDHLSPHLLEALFQSGVDMGCRMRYLQSLGRLEAAQASPPPRPPAGAVAPTTRLACLVRQSLISLSSGMQANQQPTRAGRTYRDELARQPSRAASGAHVSDADLLLSLPLSPGCQQPEVLKTLLALRLHRGNVRVGELCVRAPSDASVDAVLAATRRAPHEAGERGALHKVTFHDPLGELHPLLRSFFTTESDLGDIYATCATDYVRRVRTDFPGSLHLSNTSTQDPFSMPGGIVRPRVGVVIFVADEAIARLNVVPLGEDVVRVAFGQRTLPPEIQRKTRVALLSPPPPFPFAQSGFTSTPCGQPVAEHLLGVGRLEAQPAAGVTPFGLSLNRPHQVVIVGSMLRLVGGVSEVVAIFPDGSLLPLEGTFFSHEAATRAALQRAEAEGSLLRRMEFVPPSP